MKQPDNSSRSPDYRQSHALAPRDFLGQKIAQFKTTKNQLANARVLLEWAALTMDGKLMDRQSGRCTDCGGTDDVHGPACVISRIRTYLEKTPIA